MAEASLRITLTHLHFGLLVSLRPGHLDSTTLGIAALIATLSKENWLVILTSS